MKVRFTATAEREFEGILAFIRRDRPLAAKAFKQKVMESLRILAKFPHAGPLVQELAPDNIREIVVGPYRFLYLVYTDRVEILTAIHAAREIEWLEPT